MKLTLRFQEVMSQMSEDISALRGVNSNNAPSHPFHVPKMHLMDFTIPTEFLQQLNTWANVSRQEQEDTRTVLEELFRRTEVLGRAVQHVR